MSKLNISIPHQLSTDEARARIQKMLGNLKEEQKDKIRNVEEKWEGDSGQFSFNAMGFDLAGTIDVSASSVDIKAGLPMALSFFKGKIESLIADNAKKLLS